MFADLRKHGIRKLLIPLLVYLSFGSDLKGYWRATCARASATGYGPEPQSPCSHGRLGYAKAERPSPKRARQVQATQPPRCAFTQPDPSKRVFLTIKGRNDGVGAAIARLVPAQAYAEQQQRNWGFAGFYDRSRLPDLHNVFSNLILTFYYGDAKFLFAKEYFKSIELSLESPSVQVLRFSGDRLSDLDQLVAVAMKNCTISTSNANANNKCRYLVVQYEYDNFFHSASVTVPGSVKSFPPFNQAFLTDLANDEFLARLRQAAACGIQQTLDANKNSNFFNSSYHTVASDQHHLQFQLQHHHHHQDKNKPGFRSMERSPFQLTKHRELNIAVHIRLGDVGPPPGSESWKWVPIYWYYHILMHLERMLPRVNIHIFTSIGSYEATNRLTTNYTLEAAAVFQTLGYSVHISDESNHKGATAEAISALAHFAVADVLITAKSSFSVAAGYLNPNCVVYIPTNHQPLRGWIIMPEDRDDYLTAMALLDKELPPCLLKAGFIVNGTNVE